METYILIVLRAKVYEMSNFFATLRRIDSNKEKYNVIEIIIKEGTYGRRKLYFRRN